MLVKWHPGARARHTYVTDRLWFCHLRQLVREFGKNFESEATVTRGWLCAARCAHATL